MGVRNRHTSGPDFALVLWSKELTLVSFYFFLRIHSNHSFAQLESLIITMPGIVNRNPALYGPGPLARKPGGLGAGPPLRGLVITAMQGIAFGLVGGFGYKFFIGDPGIQAIEDYYKENPTR